MAYEKFSRDKVEEEAGPVMVEMRRLLRTLDKPWLEKLLKEVNSENMKNARYRLQNIDFKLWFVKGTIGLFIFAAIDFRILPMVLNFLAINSRKSSLSH